MEDREEPEVGSWDRRRMAGWQEYRAARARLLELLARQAEQARRRTDGDPPQEAPPSPEDGDD